MLFSQYSVYNIFHRSLLLIGYSIFNQNVHTKTFLASINIFFNSHIELRLYQLITSV